MSTSPPPAYPPQQQPPPYGGPPGYPYGPPVPGPPPRTSGTAVTGFVLSLILCVPFVTGLGGLIFGLVGITATGKPNVRGRGLAIAAVVISAVGLLGWGVASVAIVPKLVATITAGMQIGIATTTTGPAFANALASGNVSAALPLCAAGTSAGDLQATSDELRAFGSVPTVTANGFVLDRPGKLDAASMDLILAYPTGTKVLHVSLARQADRTFKITRWTVR